MRKFIFGIFFIFLITLQCLAQVQFNTAITVTLTDSNGQVWSNASWLVEVQPPFGNPNSLVNGGFPPQSPQAGFADGTGTFFVTLDDNTKMTPTGSTWKFTICPNSSVTNCSTSIQIIHGASQNLSASISADLIPISVIATPALNRAYIDTELSSSQQGQIYWRVTDNHLRGFNGTTWQDITSTGGGGGFSGKWSDLLAPTADLNAGMANFKTIFTYGAATGAIGAMFDILDGSNNTGTNYLFRVSTGTNSNAKAFTACDNGTVNCVEFNGSAVFQALGAAQIIATQVVNTGAGLGSVTLGSNGTIGGTSGANTIELAGSNQQLWLSENTNAFNHVQSVVFKDGIQHTHTGDTTNDTIYTVTVPSLPVSGGFRLTGSVVITAQGAVNTRLRASWAGSDFWNPFFSYSNTSGTSFIVYYSVTCLNQNVTNAQTCYTTQTMSSAILTAAQIPAASVTTLGITTTAPTTLIIQIQNGTNTDSQIFSNFSLEEL